MNIMESIFLSTLVDETERKIDWIRAEARVEIKNIGGDNDITDMIQDSCESECRDIVRNAWNYAVTRGCNASTVERVFTEEFEYYL